MALTAAQITTLETALDNLVTEYAAVCAAPAPNYTKGNQTISFADYLEMLQKQIEALQQTIADAQNETADAWEVRSEVY